MPDRLRTAFGHPLPERASTLMRERQSSSPDSSSGPGSGSSSGSGSAPGRGSSPDSGSASGSGSSDDNPFAAPPEDRPDQPWQPRHPSRPPNHGGKGDDDGEGRPDRPAWGSQWSDRQPGRAGGGFGGRPGDGGPGGQGGGPEGSPGGMRWDPTDPVQRRARYAVLGGMWAFFFALFDLSEIALLLGALAVYWSVSALRGGPRKPRTPESGAAAVSGAGAERPTAQPPSGAPEAGHGARQNAGRQQTTAAVSGLVTALLALAIVATGYTVQLVYRDYYTCVNDALTKSGALACNDKLPEQLEPLFGVKK